MIPPGARGQPRRASPRRAAGGGTGAGGAGRPRGRAGRHRGEPIPLDSKDPELSDYLERVRRLIKQNWVYPCVKNRETRVCEYKSTALIIEFGILKDGQLRSSSVRSASGYVIYDDNAVNADQAGVAVSRRFPRPSAGWTKGTGVPIIARFSYVVETGITNILR